MSKNQNVIDRFFDKIDLDESTGCWNFTSTISKSNCGRFTYKYKSWDAYKIGYILLGGEIPDGWELHHICENRRCVNPEHIMPVTRIIHMTDLTPTCVGYINKRKTHCPQGHAYTEDNLKPNVEGRVCLVCARRKTREWAQRKSQKEKASGTKVDKRYRFTEQQRQDIANSKEHYTVTMQKYDVSESYYFSIKRRYRQKASECPVIA